MLIIPATLVCAMSTKTRYNFHEIQPPIKETNVGHISKTMMDDEFILEGLSTALKAEFVAVRRVLCPLKGHSRNSRTRDVPENCTCYDK